MHHIVNSLMHFSIYFCLFQPCTFCDFVCLKHKCTKDCGNCAVGGCRLSVLCCDIPALPFMATHQLRKMFPSEYVFHTCFCKHLHTFFHGSLVTHLLHSTVCRSYNGTNATEPGKINWYVDSTANRRVFILSACDAL